MYRDDKNAMVEQIDSLSREATSLRRDNEAMRQALLTQKFGSMVQQNVYLQGVGSLSAGERAALSYHTVRPFPVWATGILSFITLGIFPLIHFGMQHDRLPVAAHNDPTAGKAIGFSFIPYFNLYWVFFNSMRLADRLNLQLKLRGDDADWLKGLMIACAVLTVIPYVNMLIGIPIMWTIGACMLQSVTNRVAQLGPLPEAADGLPAPANPYALPPPGLIR